jgi:hypothetical protein
MAIDASIAQGQAPQAPGQFIQNMVGLKGQMIQQNQLTQQMGANQATSQAIQQSTDPTTGRIDTNKLSAIMSQDPRAAYNLLPTQNQILENQQKQLGLDTSQFDLALKRNTYLQGAIGGLLNKPEISQNDFYGIAADAVKNGLLPADVAAKQLSGLPSDPKTLREKAQQMFFQAQDTAGKLQMMMPQNQVIDTGGTKQFVAVDPRTGNPMLTGQIQNTMAPGDANSMVQVYNPQTQSMVMVTKAQAAQMANGGGQGQQDPSTLGLPGTGANGRYPQQQTMPGIPGGGLSAGPSLGAGAAADVTAAGSAKNALSLQANAEGSPQRVMFLQNMAKELTNFNAGPAADWTAKAKALALQTFPGMAVASGIDPSTVASKEEFTKYATNLAMNSAAGLGGGTDSQLATAISGNPHAELSSLGNAQIIQVLTGIERGTQAKNMAWQNSGVPPEQYGKWSAQWAKQVDPRVFVAPEMSQEDRAKMYNALKPADQERFMQSYRTAIQSGIIQRPTQQ